MKNFIQIVEGKDRALDILLAVEHAIKEQHLKLYNACRVNMIEHDVEAVLMCLEKASEILEKVIDAEEEKESAKQKKWAEEDAAIFGDKY